MPGRILELTGGGAPHVVEAVGNQESLDLAVDVARPGGTVSFVGIPHNVKTVPVTTMSGSQPSAKGPAANFTGSVRIDPLFPLVDPARVSAALVTFEPCARTNWHTHPLGQRLIVTSGFGRVGRWGGPVEEIRPGDVVIIDAGEKHWHGAAPATAMSHIAIQEALDGRVVDWMERVTDEQYGRP